MPRAIIDTPLGPLAIESDGDRLTQIYWTDIQPSSTNSYGNDLLDEARRQLDGYFAGDLTHFDLPLSPAKSARGEALRAAIAEIPYGETASYGQVAHQAGSAPRAVGQACARNRFPVVIPCHRVLAAHGALGHYSGGRGTVTKLALLRLEAPDFQTP